MIILKLLSHQWKWYIQKKNLLCSSNQLFVFPPQGYLKLYVFWIFSKMFLICDLWHLKKYVFWIFSKMFLTCDLYLVHLAGELDGSEGGAGGHLGFSEEIGAIKTIVYWGSCAQPHTWYMEKNTNVQSEPIPTQPIRPFSIALFSVK